MDLLLESINGNVEYARKIKKEKNLLITGLTDSAKAYIALAICATKNDNSCVIITKTVQSAKKLIYDLSFFYDEEKICFLPSYELNYYDMSSESHELENERISVLRKVLDGKKIVVVTTMENAVTNILKENIVVNSNIKISNTSTYSIDFLINKFIELGYKRYDKVEGKGTFSVRGEIVDIFPVNMESPCRIEFDFESIDNIRTFDSITQRSIDVLKDVVVCQAEENKIGKEKINSVTGKLREFISTKKCTEKLKQNILNDIYKFENNDYQNIINKYFNLIQNYNYTLLDFFIKNKFDIFIDEYDRLLEKYSTLMYENSEIIEHLKASEYIYEEFVNKYNSFCSVIKNLMNKEAENSIYFLQKLDEISINGLEKIDLETREDIFYKESFQTLEQDLIKRKDKITIISLISDNRKKQVEGFLDDRGISYNSIYNVSDINMPFSNVYVVKQILSGGFVSDKLDFSIIAEPASGITRKIKRSKNKSDSNISIISSYEDLQIGDYVVHENHGIGRYLGIESINVESVIKDYIKIEYDKSGILYVPVTQLDLVKKYENYENAKVKLNSLSSKTWETTKNRARAYTKEVAKDLIKLYAKRQRKNGFCFAKDSIWQKEFEDAFEYELTDDQKEAIADIKEDMESTEIMDRLLCGDVGYGKTEVALRASFKAVMSGKQVAYLVPTTVLCLQQYNTFRSRMEGFGVKVEMLCRFRSKKEQEKNLQKLKTGEIDIIVGTHRLLSKDVVYKDLGFLVIDEEHRFGVKAKEEIKKMKESIDVLSMTATPIPRTLNMSLIGIRKMSNLLTPPIDRIPVHTYVMEYDETIISEAIKRELLRDGQVFYLKNKVDGIEDVTKKVRKLAGEDARVAYAHGQMDPTQVEDIMLKFINHELDILVCTTILESGIDIPNANLIIVEDADKLGLAQLYQIRGRVGRSSRLAYAYITYESNKQISEISEKRLKAIKDFTEFGSGYKIALRDLEIRGAGSLLGDMQHGHMISVGYNMYLSLLDKALKEEIDGNDIEGSQIEVTKEVKIDLGVSAYISDRYISDSVQKIAMYQKISDIQTSNDALEVVDELIDRYGILPKEVENLIKIVEIRNLARKIGITKICKKGEILIFEPSNLKYSLTNKIGNDILVYVQNKLLEINDILSKSK